jgi:hypothetical protein
MSVTATFQPASITSSPGIAATLTLMLRNDADAEEVVRLKAHGDLAEHTVLQSETIYLEPWEEFEVPITVDLAPALPSGTHTSSIEVTAGDSDEPTTAVASITIEEASDYAVSLVPTMSRSAGAGKHSVIVENTGNTPIAVEVAAQGTEATVIEVAAPLISVEPGQRGKVEVRVHPSEPFSSGPPREHAFEVIVTGGDRQTHNLAGVYEQQPRLRPWLLPAAAGMIGALLLGTLAWFTLLKPSVRSLADDRAALANEADQELLTEKIAELEAAAAEARSLPLGSPADLRLDVEATPGEPGTDSFTVASDRVLSVTDVVFQNPDGAVGRVSLVRSGDVLLESELANFRDLDMHFVAPFRFNEGDTVELQVNCETPGPNSDSCAVGALIVGFVDQSE